MARDLPYFKFFISEWNDGDIALCSMEAQGLFINLCSLYWSVEGDLLITKAKRRYKDCNTTVWDELISERIIKIKADKIVINFLDEQFLEREQLSKTNAKNVSKRWSKNTTVIRPNNDGIAPVYNKEKKREEKNIDTIGTGKYSVTISKVYANDKTKIIHDLEEWFRLDSKLDNLKEKGWVHFAPFIEANPGRTFSDSDHLYNSYKNFCLEYKPPEGQKNPYEWAEYNKGLWTTEAWEKEYRIKLLKDNEFRKHFGYEELRSSKTMGGNGQS